MNLVYHTLAISRRLPDDETDMTYASSFLGGILIGTASVLLLACNGRILGISGIAGGLFGADRGERKWRAWFLAGLLAGGLVVRAWLPAAFTFGLTRSSGALIAAGLLVGLGTRIGGGCTSGHGICGVSRLSARSLAATAIFMACGAATVFVIGHFLGGRI